MHIEPENVADVTGRLADILDTSVELTDVDVEIVADVIDRVALVPKLPKDVCFQEPLLNSPSRPCDCVRACACNYFYERMNSELDGSECHVR